MILTDTSVWVDHLRVYNPEFAVRVEAQVIATHPFIIGELSCGTLHNRAEFLSRLRLLPAAVMASEEEVGHLIESRRLWGRGIGWVDAHLLASALLTRCKLWTFDQRLDALACELGINPRAKSTTSSVTSGATQR